MPAAVGMHINKTEKILCFQFHRTMFIFITLRGIVDESQSKNRFVTFSVFHIVMKSVRKISIP